MRESPPPRPDLPEPPPPLHVEGSPRPSGGSLSPTPWGAVEAVPVFIIAMLIIWGGLVLAVLNLRRSPDVPREDELRRDL